MQKQNVIEETKVAVSYFKETVAKLSKLCKKFGFDSITPENFKLHFKKNHSQSLSASVYKWSLNLWLTWKLWKQWIKNFQITFHWVNIKIPWKK